MQPKLYLIQIQKLTQVCDLLLLWLTMSCKQFDEIAKGLAHVSCMENLSPQHEIDVVLHQSPVNAVI